MKKITFLLVMLITCFGFAQTSLLQNGQAPNARDYGNSTMQNNLASCNFLNPSGTITNGLGMYGTQYIADDFDVAAGEEFSPTSLTFEYLNFNPNMLTSLNIYFYASGGTTPTGGPLNSLIGLAAASQTVIGTAYGRDNIEATYDLSGSGVTLSGGPAGTKYWLVMVGVSSGGDQVYWTAGSVINGVECAVSIDSGATWFTSTGGFGAPFDPFFNLSGDCAVAPISVCGTGNPQPIPAVGTGNSACNDPTISLAAVTAVGNIGTASGDYTLDSVEIDLTHSWDSDLDITLISPSGTMLDLSSDNGSSGDNYTNTVFMDGAPNITTGSPPFTGNFEAEGGTFAATFAGEPINGNWTLSICDDAGGDFGELLSYCINFSEITTVGNPPTIVCPTNITVYNSPGTCGAAVNFAGVAFDDEDGNISGDIVATPASGSVFPVGDTMVTLTVTDSDGNTEDCSFMVTVVDDEDPVAVCQDITIDLDPVTGMATIAAADLDNGSMDNCAIASMTLDVSTFDCSMVGANTVTMTVTDTAGRTATCTSTVTVQDVTPPEVFCIGGFGIFTESEDFNGPTIPTGWTTMIDAGVADWGFGSGDMPNGDDFATNAAIFDDDGAGIGETNLVRLLSPVYDLTGASNVTVGYDVAFQESGDQEFIVEVFDGAAWQQIAFYDADLDPDIQTESIDVSAFVNAAFQVRYTFDDLGGWGWGAGVDNFLLTYEAASGGGLDVFLDANGMASISPNDLVTGVNEACGYTITAGGVGGGTTGSLSTVFIGTNGGSSGWTVMYDVTVGPADIQVTELDINSISTTAFDLDLYVLTGTYVGNETNAAAWGPVAASGSGVGAGTDLPSNVVLDTPVVLSANTTYGFAVVTTGLGQRYTNGDGTNQNYSNGDLSMSLGTAVAGLFTGSIFSPRVWNGTVHYETLASSGLEFTCADLGENIIEVTVTDDSGNASTCMAVVNVIDNIAPVITCGVDNITSELTDFEGASIPAGWSTVVTTGSADWAFGSGDMPIGTDFPTNAAIFDDDAAGIGEVNLVTLISPVYDISTALAASISFDYAMQEFAGDGTLTVEIYDGAAWQQILFVDVSTNPTNTGALDMAAYMNADFQVRFTYDDEGGWAWGAGVDNFQIDYEGASTGNVVEIELGPDGTTTIDPYSLLSDIDEACGIDTIAVDVPTVTCADIGTPVMVTVFVSDTSGNLASCVAEVHVVDRLAPELTCPADQTVDPGPGNIFYIVPDYFATGEAIADDNCTDPVTDTTQDPAAGTALPDGVYTVSFTATDEYGNMSSCDFELTVESVLGVNQNTLEAGVVLYPNPASNVVNLVNKTNISLEKMMIYDVNGKLVNQIDLRTMQGEKAVDVSSLAAGVYMVQIIGDKASTVKRLIKD